MRYRLLPTLLTNDIERIGVRTIATLSADIVVSFMAMLVAIMMSQISVASGWTRRRHQQLFRLPAQPTRLFSVPIRYSVSTHCPSLEYGCDQNVQSQRIQQ